MTEASHAGEQSLESLIGRLRAILGPEGVLTGDDVTGHTGGWAVREPCAATAVLRPQSTEEVSHVLRLCWEADQPVCVQGGMTGLVHGGVARGDEIVLSLERMSAIEDIDPVGRTMTVQAGAPLQAIQKAADGEGLLFPLDLGARGSCQIGGNVATNAGGNRVIRFGMTRDLVLGVEAVLADGTVVPSLYAMLKNNSGYDLKQLFIGSEGTLGIVTRVILRLERRPRSNNVALVALASFEHVIDLLRAMEEGLGPNLSAFEVMWSDFYELVTSPPAQSAPPVPHGSPFYTLVESLGSDETADREAFEQTFADAFESGVIEDAVFGSSSSERDKLWELRDDIEQMGRLGPNFTYDVSLRISDMKSYVDEVEARLADRFEDPKCIVFGHLGDGNLHLVVAVGDGSPDTRRAVEEIVYSALRPLGGSVSAEHGIGFEKRPYLSWSRSASEIDLMHTLKQALDPKGILNPGRVLEPR